MINLYKTLIIALLSLLGFIELTLAETQSVKYKNYTITFETNTERPWSKLIVTRGKAKLVEISGVISMLNGYELQKIDNVNSIHSPLLIINNFTGGANCCFETAIIKLEDKFKLDNIDGGKDSVQVKTLANGNFLEITLRDWTYAYRWTSGAASPAPPVMLRDSNGKYEPYVKSMRKNKLTKIELTKAINKIKSTNYVGFKYAGETIVAENEQYFALALKIMLNLTYSGNYPQAIYVLDQTWPGDVASKRAFIKDFNKVINESPYAKVVKELNK